MQQQDLFIKFWYKVGIIVILPWLVHYFLHLYNEVMNNISKYFDKSSKKRDLSGESNPKKERKKVREGSSKSSNANDTIDDEVFQQTNSASDISEILVSLRKLEEKRRQTTCWTNGISSTRVRHFRWFRKRYKGEGRNNK